MRRIWFFVVVSIFVSNTLWAYSRIGFELNSMIEPDVQDNATKETKGMAFSYEYPLNFLWSVEAEVSRFLSESGVNNISQKKKRWELWPWLKYRPLGGESFSPYASLGLGLGFEQLETQFYSEKHSYRSKDEWMMGGLIGLNFPIYRQIYGGFEVGAKKLFASNPMVYHMAFRIEFTL